MSIISRASRPKPIISGVDGALIDKLLGVVDGRYSHCSNRSEQWGLTDPWKQLTQGLRTTSMTYETQYTHAGRRYTYELVKNGPGVDQWTWSFYVQRYRPLAQGSCLESLREHMASRFPKALECELPSLTEPPAIKFR